MTSRILTLLATAALPSAALAHPGHIADTGQGHSHWYIYVLVACAAFGLASLIRARAKVQR
jgi:hypothetical protein